VYQRHHSKCKFESLAFLGQEELVVQV